MFVAGNSQCGLVKEMFRLCNLHYFCAFIDTVED